MENLHLTETCTIKVLPREEWITAARTATSINPANAPAFSSYSQAMLGNIISPENLAILTSKYWGSSGVKLTVSFLDNPPPNLRARILSHMNAWGEYSNVEFIETNGVGQVRISRTARSGYWSYLGTDILHIPINMPTMNLDSFTMNTPDSEFYRVIRHETGHTLGFPREHLRSDIIDRIDRNKALAYFEQTQGWSEQQVIAQVLTPLDNSALIATADADPESIMCYWLPASIMMDNISVMGGSDIDGWDARFVALIYPEKSRLDKGSFNTGDVRFWSHPSQSNKALINFAKKFSSQPGLPIGLNELDLDRSANIRISTFADHVTKTGFKVHIDSWADTVLYSGGCRWLEIPPEETEIQWGQFNTQEDHLWEHPKAQTTKRVVFSRPYNEPPQVVVWLNSLDMSNSANWRVKAYATDIDQTGFTLHIDTWADSILYSAGVTWIAHPANSPKIASMKLKRGE